MAPKTFTPPTPSPSAGHELPESLCVTPVATAPGRRIEEVSPPLTPRGRIYTTDSGADSIVPTAPPMVPPSDPLVQDPASDFLTLHARAKLGTHAFRIHSPESAPDSSLIWSGNPASSGFFPYNAQLGCSAAVYLKTLGLVRVDAPRWENGAYIRHTMVDHINGKMRQSLLNIPSHLEERPGTPEDEKSPWISGTRSLMWAIWEVARRLAWAESVVGFAVICCQDEAAAEWLNLSHVNVKAMTELEQWRRADEMKRRGYIAKEVLVNPLKPIANAIGAARAGEMSVSMKEAYENALRSARVSEEVLWYGRVFAESVERNVEFSAENLPIELPPQFYAPCTSGPDRHRLVSPLSLSRTGPDRGSDVALDGWLSHLVWDPRCDEYERAVQKVVERRRQLCLARGVRSEDCPITAM